MEIKDKVILITGSTDGLGKAVARHLAGHGATILLHGRNPEKGRGVLNEVAEISGDKKHRYYNADFSSLQQVLDLSEAIQKDHDHLDILINNAGIGSGSGKRETGAEGYELRFTVNYLASFLLTTKLLPLLQKPGTARIVNVASGAQQKIDFDDVMLNRQYTGSRAYAQSKLALIMFTFDLADQLRHSGVMVNGLHPASMMDTNLVRQSGGTPRTNVAEGVDTVVFVSTSSRTASVSGAFFDHHDETPVEQQAYDHDSRSRLHQITIDLLTNFL